MEIFTTIDVEPKTLLDLQQDSSSKSSWKEYVLIPLDKHQYKPFYYFNYIKL